MPIIYIEGIKPPCKPYQVVPLVLWGERDIQRLKGHGNEADFLGFLKKLVSHRSLTLPFEPFRFWLQFAEIFIIEKRLPDSASLGVGNSPTNPVGESLTLRLGFWMFKWKFGESESRWLLHSVSLEVANSPDSVSRRVVDLPSRWVAMVSWGITIQIF